MVGFGRVIYFLYFSESFFFILGGFFRVCSWICFERRGFCFFREIWRVWIKVLIVFLLCISIRGSSLKDYMVLIF